MNHQSGAGTSAAGGQPPQQQQQRKRSGRPLKFHPAGLELTVQPMHFSRNACTGLVSATGLIGGASATTSPTPTSTSIPAAAVMRPRRLAAPTSLESATLGLLEVFTGCNGSFVFDKGLNPRRVLTKPSRPTYNSGFDNEKHDYILYVNDVLGNEEGRKYDDMRSVHLLMR